MTNPKDLGEQIDKLNHIGDGRILATKEQLLQLIQSALIEELQMAVRQSIYQGVSANTKYAVSTDYLKDRLKELTLERIAMGKEYPDQTRNLNPTLEARVAMIIYGRAYSVQNGGSMEFWDRLDDYNKRVCKLVVEMFNKHWESPKSAIRSKEQ